MDRATADYMGMLATVMNSLALADTMRQEGMVARVMSAISIEQVVEPYAGRRHQYREGKVVVFAAGTGNPFFTTDTAAALRGAEIGAEIVLRRPRWTASTALTRRRIRRRVRYARITFDEAITRNLQVMDATAFALCRDQKLPIKVFSIFKPGALRRAVVDEDGHPGSRLRAADMTSPSSLFAAPDGRSVPPERPGGTEMSIAEIRPLPDRNTGSDSFQAELVKIRTGARIPASSTRCTSSTTARCCRSARWPT